MVSALALVSLVGTTLLSLEGQAGEPPRLVLRSFEIHTLGSPDFPSVHRRIALAAPAGWSPTGRPTDSELELLGPEGVGRMMVFAGLHPSHLGPVLTRLKKAHPAAVPSPPEKMDLPGLRPELGERATRFQITGREVGEMVLIERHQTIVLLVTVVEPNAWEGLKPLLSRVYPTVSISDLPGRRKSQE